MFSWTPYALLRFCLFFIAGVLFAIYSSETIPQTAVLITLLSTLLLYFLLYPNKLTRNILQRYGYLLVILFSFSAGYLRLQFHHAINLEDHISKANSTIQAYQISIIQQPEEKERSYKSEGEILNIKTTAWQKSSGKVLLYFSKNSEAANLKYGDILLIRGSPQVIAGPANPHEFNYKRFLSFKNIYHQQFLTDVHWQKIGFDPQNIFINYSQLVRSWALNKLNTHIIGKQQQVIAQALVLGVRDGIDNDLAEAYAASGAMHVLAVSGLHVGVIYLLLNFVFKRISWFEKRKWLQAIASMLLLWAFAFVTGLSASVLRAVTMFSLFAMARAAGRGENIYNTLAIAALILLLIDPFLIMSVGFQLSFLAVIGIVSITQSLYYLWEPHSLLLDRIWKITCVAFAAQLSTFSLGMLYFHQFPVYFFFSNLFVIPAAFIILLSGIVCLMLSFVPPLAGIIGGIMEVCIWTLNKIVFAIEALPYSKIDNIYLDTFQTWLLLLLIGFIVIFFFEKKLIWLKLSFVLVMAFSVFTWKHFYTVRTTASLNFYKVNGLLAIDWIENGTAVFFTDQDNWQDKERQRFHIRPNRLANSVNTVHKAGAEVISDLPWARLLVMKNKSLLILKESPPQSITNIKVDFVVPDRDWNHKLSDLSGKITFDQLILSPAINYKQSRKLGKEALDLGIPLYDIKQQGALVIKL